VRRGCRDFSNNIITHLDDLLIYPRISFTCGKSQSDTAVTVSNFREDVTIDGSINAGDIGLVKSKSGTGLP
jgi:hypothetical protein